MSAIDEMIRNQPLPVSLILSNPKIETTSSLQSAKISISFDAKAHWRNRLKLSGDKSPIDIPWKLSLHGLDQLNENARNHKGIGVASFYPESEYWNADEIHSWACIDSIQMELLASAVISDKGPNVATIELSNAGSDFWDVSSSGHKIITSVRIGVGNDSADDLQLPVPASSQDVATLRATLERTHAASQKLLLWVIGLLFFCAGALIFRP